MGFIRRGGLHPARPITPELFFLLRKILFALALYPFLDTNAVCHYSVLSLRLKKIRPGGGRKILHLFLARNIL